MLWSLLQNHCDGFRRICYRLHQNLKWSQPGFEERVENKTTFFERYPALTPLEQTLLNQYPRMKSVRERASLQRYRECLNTLEALHCMTETLPWPRLSDQFEIPLTVLEVGPKNWSTVDATASYLQARFGPQFVMTGVELDPWLIYPDGHSRWDYAQYFCRFVPQASYLAGNVMDHYQPHDMVLVFLPFLFQDTHCAWGLPQELFQPEAFVQHIVTQLLRPGGLLLITNQTEAEWDQQGQLLAPFNLQVHFSGPISQSFYTWHYPRLGWVVQKPL